MLILKVFWDAVQIWSILYRMIIEQPLIGGFPNLIHESFLLKPVWKIKKCLNSPKNIEQLVKLDFI